MSTLGERIARALQKKNGGNQSELARFVGVSSQAVQQWISGETSPRGKNLRKAAEFLGVSAAELEYGESLPVPSLTYESAAPEGGGGQLEVHERRLNYNADAVDIPVLNAEGSMGPGRIRPEHDAVIDFIRVSRGFIRRELPSITSPAALRIVTAYGDSMEDTFSDGDPLFVDTGITELKLDAVYVLARGDELFIKRVQRRMDGSISIKSDNKLYDPYIIPANEVDSLEVLGRVVLAWRGKRL